MKKLNKVHVKFINLSWNFNSLGKFRDEQNFYIFIEIVYGSPLHKIMNMSGGKLKLNFVRFISTQILLLLKYIHEKGYIYRDLKASNIIINP
jgi:serine/threonine protein kinase